MEKTKQVTAETLSSKAFLKFVLSFHSSHSHGQFSCVWVSCTQRRQFSHTKLILNCRHQVWVWGYWGSSVCPQGPSSSVSAAPQQFVGPCTKWCQEMTHQQVLSTLNVFLLFSSSESLVKKKVSPRTGNVTSSYIYYSQSLQPQLINRDSLKGTLLNGEVSFPFRLPTAFLYIA